MPNAQAHARDRHGPAGAFGDPVFTNPNNLSIATGRPPSVHGICGNYLYDPDTGEEVMMNDVRFLRAPTVFSKFYEAGARVAVVTAKDKLRALLGAGLKFDEDRAIAFSSERSGDTTKAEHGIDNARLAGHAGARGLFGRLSEFVFAAGVKLLREWKPDVMYLSTTDYIQHKFAPDEQGPRISTPCSTVPGELDAMGAAIVVTADHGMKPKHDANGDPAVIYVQDLLDDWLGKAAPASSCRSPTLCGASRRAGLLRHRLSARRADRADIVARLRALPEMLEVTTRPKPCAKYELPADRIGDIVMISTENMTIGTSAHRHDLAALKEPLRSHGGLTEQEVPFIVNRVIDLPNAPALRNFDAFFYATTAAAMEEVDGMNRPDTTSATRPCASAARRFTTMRWSRCAIPTPTR
jgi:phosphonoacetate hydrolase